MPMAIHVRRDRTLRVKVTDACGLTCDFCHNEGTPVAVDQPKQRRIPLPIAEGGRSGRVSIYAATNGAKFIPAMMLPDEAFTSALVSMRDRLDIGEVHLTGGEPTLHPRLPELITIARTLGLTVAMTSNGQNGARLIPHCADAGLSRVNFSIFGTTAAELASVQGARYASIRSAQRKLDDLADSIDAAIKAGVPASANLVVPGYSHKPRVINLLEHYSMRLSIRLLNSLDEGVASIKGIHGILRDLGAVPVERLLIAGTSSARTVYRLPSGRLVHFKQIRPVRLPRTCSSCRFSNDRECQEGYYGLRLYRDRKGRYQVGVCIQRMDLCQPVEQFVTSEIAGEVLRFRETEYAALRENLDYRPPDRGER
ncbi:radical SAM protein [Actinomadura formosensis]|uniref:radical SAM protein n=1 Tax=Actinomadura formosensis TaxID=60706 RepID=UPI00082BEDFE|nr:radical SAM protein [Actinomadura formosensis]